MAFTLANLKEIEATIPAAQEAGFADNLMAIQDGTANTTLASGKILVGDGNGAGQPVDLSGDATLSNVGALTITHKLNRVITPAAHAAAISVTTSGTMAFVIADAAETNTLANPSFAGQVLALSVDTLAGTGTRAVTVASAVNAAGNTVLTFNATSDTCVLMGMTVAGGLKWRVVHNDGVSLS